MSGRIGRGGTSIEEGRRAKAGQEEVVMKASGKAIARLLNLGMWFQEQEGGARYRVRVRTGGVGAVDDIVVDDDRDQSGKGEKADARERLPETRIRRVPTVEVGVSLM